MLTKKVICNKNYAFILSNKKLHIVLFGSSKLKGCIICNSSDSCNKEPGEYGLNDSMIEMINNVMSSDNNITVLGKYFRCSKLLKDVNMSIFISSFLLNKNVKDHF